jgi:hypothetical protein
MVLSEFSPRLYPDEHLLSAIARLARLKGERNLAVAFPGMKGDTYIFLPGAILRPWYRTIAPLFPAMTIDALISHHTLWNYYKPFMQPMAKEVPDPALWEENFNNHSQWLPSKQFRIKHTKYWRWCIDCVASDEEQFGVSYWHCSHQLPGVMNCQKHSTRLASACFHCGYSVNKLEPHLKPSKSSDCPDCGKTLYEPVPDDKYGFLSWLQKTSTELLTGESNFEWNLYKTEIIQGNNLKSMSANRSVSNRKNYQLKQRQLEALIGDEIPNLLFTQPGNNDSYRAAPTMDIRLLCSGDLYPPISYLLIMWAFYIHESNCEIAS